MFVALGIQHAERMRRIILSPCPVRFLPHFSTLSYKRHDFRGGGGDVIEYKICVLIFCTTFSVMFFIIRPKRDIIMNVLYIVRVKYPLFLSDCKETWIFWPDFRAINIKFRENPSSGIRVVPSWQTERQGEAYSRFSQFCESAWTSQCNFWPLQHTAVPRLAELRWVHLCRYVWTAQQCGSGTLIDGPFNIPTCHCSVSTVYGNVVSKHLQK